MRRFAVLPAALLLSLGASPAALAQSAQKPHMELVRGLRNNGMADLALQYLDELKAKNPPPAVAELLPLEYARTWIDLASEESEEGKRTTLISQARHELNVFINANPKHDQTPQANVDLARLLSLQGKSILTRARKIEEEKAKKAELARARAALKEAADKYQSTAALVDKQLKDLDNDMSPARMQLKRELTRFRLRAQIDQGVNLFDMGETYVGDDSADVIARGDQFVAAKKIFDKVMYQDDKEPLCWVARAWAAECEHKGGRMDDAERAFKDLMSKRTNPASSAGIRVARYFGIFHSFEKSDKLDARGKFLKAEKEATDWLRDYAMYRNTPEGLGARYYLAFVKMELGKGGLQRDKMNKVTGMTTTAKAFFEDAQRMFKELTDTENEFTEKANRFRSQVLVTIADAEGHGDAPAPETLGSFERCYLMAQVQIARLAQYRLAVTAPKDVSKNKEPEPKKVPDPKKKGSEPKKKDAEPIKGEAEPKEPAKKDDDYKKEELRRYTNAVRYLEHGLTLANPAKDSVRDIFSAQLFLVGCYFQLKLYPQAAILAEHIARDNPKMGRAPTAGMVAVQAYNMAFIKLRQSGEVPQPVLDADVNRLRRAAQFVVAQWPLESSTDEARHILGFFLARDKKFEDAWKAYAEIKPSYPAVQSARLELASVMFTLVYPTDEKDPTKFNQIVKDRIKQFDAQWKQTISLLESVTPPDEDCLKQDAVGYLESRAQLARLYQLEGLHQKAQPIGTALVKAAGTFEALSDDDKANFTHTGQHLVLSSVRAAAYTAFNDGNHAKVAELLNPKIDEMRKDFAAASTKELTLPLKRLRNTQRDVLILALQSSVQDQKIDRADEMLDILEKSGNTVEGNLGIYQTMVGSVRSQIEALELAKKTAEAKILKDGFSKLLGKIAAKSEKLPTKTAAEKQVANNMKLFIARGYQGIDAYTEAGKLLDAIRQAEPPTLPAGANDEQQAQFEEARENHAKIQKQVQFLMARNHRMAKEYPEALKILSEMIGPKVTAKDPVPKKLEDRGWAFASMDVRKEKAHVLEDQAKNAKDAGIGAKTKTALWADAVQEWVAIQTAFAPRLTPLKDLTLIDLARQLPEDELQQYAKLDAEKRKDFVLARRLTEDEKKKYDEFGNEKKKEFIAELRQKYDKLSDEKRREFVMARMNPAEQQLFAREAGAITVKRTLYFDLFFEQKRCSVKAFTDLGLAAVKGNQIALDEKFAKFAQDFHDFQTKNKDLPQSIRDRVKDLIEETPKLKAAYKNLPTGG